MAKSDDTYAMRRTPQGSATHGPALSDEFAQGSRLGEYVIERLLAAGGHGAVYVAQHRVLGRRAAVKVLRRDLAESPEMVARFVREAQVVNLIRHPSIVDIYDIGVLADGRPFCVMELIAGRSLAQVVAEHAPLSPAEAVSYLGPVCDALDAAHRVDVVHRDVKASNVIVSGEGAALSVKLLDFGVAKVHTAVEDGLTAVGQRIGTSSAMSPEQIRGEPVDARTDVYALGVLLHLMLTGRYPFAAADRAEVERMHLEAVPPRPSALAPVPPAFDAVVARCLEKSGARRWQTAGEVAAAARAALGEAPGERSRHAAAVAIHVRLDVPAPPDEAALLAQADTAELAEQALRGGGFAVPLATGGAVLAVRLLPAAPEAARAARADAVSLARDLAARLEGSGVVATIVVHAGEAEVRERGGVPEIVGGPVCDVEGWARGAPPGATGTVAALDGLDS
jgi:tRNA A-37 threonylcarbamoyl transferase component Bud32